MQLADLLSPACTTCSMQAASKKRVLELIAHHLAECAPELASSEVFDSLIGRERLGSTGLGNGVALPHGRITGLERAVAMFVKLAEPIDFDAIDARPVDLIFALLVPEHFTDEHLQILSLAAEMFSDEVLCGALREAADDAELFAQLMAWAPPRRDPMNSVSVEHLLAEAGDRLGLQWVESEEYGCDLIEPVAECESGVCLVGHLNLIHPSRVQVLGDSELDYLGSLGDNSRRIALQQLFSGIASMVVIANGNLPPDYVVAQARTSHVPLFTSTLPTQDLINRLQFYLARMLAEHATMHGVFMDVLGVGVLISGPCGAGKSELALELITRGHRLVADDVTEFTRINPDAVSGVCPPLLRDFLEVRGMGILNIRAMFGDAALRVDKDLGLIIRLECMNNEGMQSIDRLHGTHRRTLVLDIEVAEVTLPVAPGRNLAVLVETAVRNHILRASGYDSAGDFIARQRLAIDRGDA